MVLNLESRLAQRVLIEVAEGAVPRRERPLRSSPAASTGRDWITPRQTLRVDSTAQRSPLKSLNFAALRVKDAVCDRMRDEHRRAAERRHGRARPALVLHVGPSAPRSTSTARASRSSSAAGARTQGDAPLKETLAAAMLAAAGWRGTPAEGGALHDPCCGSGTIAIEAAQIACGIAPGRAAPLRLRAPAAVRDARAARRVAAPASRRRRRACARRRCRSSPATSRSGWSTSRAATPSAPASPRRSSSTAATRSSGRRRRCPPSCPAR